MSSLIEIAYHDTLEFTKEGVVAVGDNQFKVKAPFDGEILEHDGWLDILGGGAGTSTDVQIRNENTSVDYFATLPTFEVDSATKRLEGGVLINSPTFKKDEWLVLDVDVVSTNPADMTIRLMCILVRRVSV